MITSSLHELRILMQIFETKNPYSLFDFLFYPIITNNPHKPDDFFFSIGLDRTFLGLSNAQKPGDFDLMIIPLKKSQPIVDYIGVIEVKIARPTLTNKSRDTNTSGKDQVIGLIRDDFPFIGLAHILVPEKVTSKKYTNSFYGKEFSGEDIGNALELEERQLGRMKKLKLPHEVGICATSIYDYGGVSHNGTSCYEFCKQREFNKQNLSKKISYALKEHKDKFYLYK